MECVAAADLYDGRHTLAKEIAGAKVKTTRKYQELLDDQEIDCLIAAADQAGRGWAKERAVALYRAALELVPSGDEGRQGLIKRRLAVALQAMYHVVDAEHLRRADAQP